MMHLAAYNCVLSVLLDRREAGNTCAEESGTYVETFPARKSAVINMFCNCSEMANVHTDPV
jgi:hypothetical protein